MEKADIAKNAAKFGADPIDRAQIIRQAERESSESQQMKVIYEVSQFFKDSSSEEDVVTKVKTEDAAVKIKAESLEKKADPFTLLAPVDTTEYEPIYPLSSQDAEEPDGKPQFVRTPGRKRVGTKVSSQSANSSTDAEVPRRDCPDASANLDGARIFAETLLKNRRLPVTDENIKYILDQPPKIEAADNASSSIDPPSSSSTNR